MSVAGIEFLDKVIIVGGYGNFTFSASDLFLIRYQRYTFDVSAMADGDNHRLIRDQIFDVDIIVVVFDIGNTRNVELFNEFNEFPLDNIFENLFTAEDAL